MLRPSIPLRSCLDLFKYVECDGIVKFDSDAFLSYFGQEIPVLGKFGSRNRNYRLKMSYYLEWFKYVEFKEGSNSYPAKGNLVWKAKIVW